MPKLRSSLKLSAPLLGLLWSALVPVAEAGSYYATSGGWVYDVKGRVQLNEPLDLQRDLHLRTTDKGEFTLGYIPEKLGWIPGLDLGYVHLAAEGEQTVGRPVQFGPLSIGQASVVATSAAIDDIDACIRWPYVWANASASAGVTVVRLNGNVVVADTNTGQQNNQPIDEIFPLLSLAGSYRPIDNLRLSARGDYIQYSGNTAHTLEAGAFYKFLGPVGFEVGWRQRRFKINNPNGYNFDARLSGARIALRFEFSR